MAAGPRHPGVPTGAPGDLHDAATASPGVPLAPCHAMDLRRTLIGERIRPGAQYMWGPSMSPWAENVLLAARGAPDQAFQEVRSLGAHPWHLIYLGQP